MRPAVPPAGSDKAEAFRGRRLEGRFFPVCGFDEKVEKVRDGARVVGRWLVVAHAVHETRRREVIGLDVGEPNTKAFWTEFVRSGVARGLVGVQLAISDT